MMEEGVAKSGSIQEDVTNAFVATNALFLCRAFVGGNWMVSLAWNDG
jgi:hypothetical protein